MKKQTSAGVATYNRKREIISFTTNLGVTLSVGEEIIANGRIFVPKGTKGVLKKILDPKHSTAIFSVLWSGENHPSNMKTKDMDLLAMNKVLS